MIGMKIGMLEPGSFSFQGTGLVCYDGRKLWIS